MKLRKIPSRLTMGVMMSALLPSVAAARADEVVRRVIPFAEMATTATTDLPPADSDQPRPYALTVSPTRLSITMLPPSTLPATIGPALISSRAMPTIPLEVIENPPLHGGPFFIRGRVSYKVSFVPHDNLPLGPQQPGCANLTLESLFADGSSIFTRNDEGQGLMRYFTGKSDERPFAVTLATPSGKVPVQLKLNLEMNSPGTITFERADDAGKNGGLQLVGDVTVDTSAVASTIEPSPPPQMASSPAALATALRIDPTLADGLGKQNFLLAQLALQKSEFGASSPQARQVEGKLRSLQAEMDEGVAEALTVKARQPHWIEWLDSHATSAWWGMLVLLCAVSAAWMKRPRFQWIAAASVVVLGECCFGWGMAALGSGERTDRYATPIVLGVVFLALPLLLQPWIRRREAAELRRIAAMDLA